MDIEPSLLYKVDTKSTSPAD